MDEKEIHSKSTLKRSHLIPETLTDLIVARGRGETGKFNQRMFMVVHLLLVTWRRPIKTSLSSILAQTCYTAHFSSAPSPSLINLIFIKTTMVLFGSGFCSECHKEINKTFKSCKIEKETCLKYNHNLFFQLLFYKALVEGQYCLWWHEELLMITDEKKDKTAKCHN